MTMDFEGREPVMTVDVSFDGSGAFDDAIDALRDRLIESTLFVSTGRDEAIPGGRPKTPEFGWQSHNEDRALSNFLASSPRYRLMRPGKPARVTMSAGSTGWDDRAAWDGPWFWEGNATITVGTGPIKTPRQSSALGNKIVDFTASGRSARFIDTKISTTLRQDIRVDQAITVILDAVGWPAADRELAIADTTLTFWWLDDEEPLSALIALLDTEGIPSAMYERGDGVFVFQNRNWRTTAYRSVNTRAVFFDNRITGSVEWDDNVEWDGTWPYGDVVAALYESGIEDDPLYDEIFNAATMTVKRRVVQSAKKVWEYGESLVLSASEVRDVPFTTSDPCSSFTSLSSGTDYTVSAGSLATTPTFPSTNAQRGVIRFTAGAGGATVIGVTSNGPQLRATPAEVVREIPVANLIDASEAIAENDGIVRTYPITARQEIAQATGEALCDAAVAHHQHQRSRIQLTVRNIDKLHLIRQLTLEVSDRITVKSTQLGYGISEELGDFWVEQKSLRREPAELVCTLACQQILPEAGGALWDEGLWDSGVWAR